MAEMAAFAPYLLAGLGGAVAASALNKSPSAPAPTVTPPTTMPTPGDAADRASKRLSLMQQMQRRGRASTILTDQPAAGDKLGA
jgi:hypothetical protein